MRAALLIMLQAGANGPAPLASDFDLARLPERGPDLAAALRCRAGDGSEADEIVVCARRPRNEDYPVDPKADYARKPIRAEKQLGGGAVAGVWVDSATMANGEVSQRITIGIKVPF